MVDLPSIFWNQVREKLTAWYKHLHLNQRSIGYVLPVVHLTSLKGAISLVCHSKWSYSMGQYEAIRDNRKQMKHT
jgi:hypothetical protein